MIETTQQEVRADQQEDKSQYPSLSAINHNELTSIILFDLIVAQNFDCGDPRTIAFAADFADDAAVRS